jgi:hypothetical protein
MSPSTRTRVLHSGHNRYSRFQHEGGGHRFQRRETGTGQNADVGVMRIRVGRAYLKSDEHSNGASSEVAEADQQRGILLPCIKPFKVRCRLYKTGPFRRQKEEFTPQLALNIYFNIRPSTFRSRK